MQPSTEIGQAMMTILKTLPVGMEVCFFWKDGIQHMSLKYPDGFEEIARLNCSTAGNSFIPANAVH